ncbi:ubiquitin-conjugating enzyme E2 D2B [Drosophila gunungcola]|uniref:E2 ubiquitin-conjugating enzyme n=1 Tax=Drosophila gunungcola TaxID=103775 RepID=A0A9P9YLW7_9MUSC|nr:ubiquitin-conjugating enzyme E2 D2B [Drosophila gunungcola]KAI8039316.1 hypothetical protein M5D96_008039 [Drosophila gunungcola]
MPARRSERIRRREEANAAAAVNLSTNSNSENRLHRVRTPNAQASRGRSRRRPSITFSSLPRFTPLRTPPRVRIANRAPTPHRLGEPFNEPTEPEFLFMPVPSFLGTVPNQGDAIATSRLKKEFNVFAKGPVDGCKAELVDENLFHWIATIPGPPDTPYEGGCFKMDLIFPENYPFQPPHIEFRTRIFHCNITISGYICLDILKGQWSPALSVPKVLISIMSLLADPNPADPLELEIAQLYLGDPEKHNEIARQWTHQYAKP